MTQVKLLYESSSQGLRVIIVNCKTPTKHRVVSFIQYSECQRVKVYLPYLPKYKSGIMKEELTCYHPNN